MSISEEGSSDLDGLVEKGGTGIQAREVEGCQPVFSIMANFMTNFHDAEVDHMERDQYISGRRYEGMKPTIH